MFVLTHERTTVSSRCLMVPADIWPRFPLSHDIPGEIKIT